MRFFASRKGLFILNSLILATILFLGCTTNSPPAQTRISVLNLSSSPINGTLFLNDSHGDEVFNRSIGLDAGADFLILLDDDTDDGIYVTTLMLDELGNASKDLNHNKNVSSEMIFAVYDDRIDAITPIQ